MKTLRRICKTSKDWAKHIEQCNMRSAGGTRHVGMIGKTIAESVDNLIPPLPLIVASIFDNTGKKFRERRGQDLVDIEQKVWYHFIFGMADAAVIARMVKDMKAELAVENGEEPDSGPEVELNAVKLSPKQAQVLKEREEKEDEERKARAAELAAEFGLGVDDPESDEA